MAALGLLAAGVLVILLAVLPGVVAGARKPPLDGG